MDINIKAIHFDITDTFEEAIDVALDALEKQLEKAKNKK